MRFLLFTLLLTSPAIADSISSRGSIGVEGRAFLPDAPGTKSGNVAITSRLEAKWKKKRWRAKGRVYGLADAVDSGRTAVFIEELWAQWKKRKLRVIAGYQLFNWSAMEVFHPVDVLNSRYIDSSVQYPEKLGELALSVRYKLPEGKGSFEAFLLPLVTDPVLPSYQSRFAFAPIPFAGNRYRHRYSDDTNGSQWEPQWAARLQLFFDKFELTGHIVQQVDRQQPLGALLPPTMTSPPSLELTYLPQLQVGGTLQWVQGAFVWKGQGVHRWVDEPTGLERDHSVVAAGVEWTKGHKSGGESRLLAEAQWLFAEDRDQLNTFLFSNHALLGWRYAWNDEQSTTLLLSVLQSLRKYDEQLLSAEWARRLGETWTLTLGARFVYAPVQAGEEPRDVERLHNANQLYGALRRFF